MFESLESGIGLDVVVWLQNNGNRMFDYLAKLLHFCGSPISLLLVVPIIFAKINRTLAWQFFVALLLSMLVATIGKEIFQTTRPHLAYPSQVHNLVNQNGFGFPSGHVITAVMVTTLLCRWIKHQWRWFVGVLYVILVGWSRMYAGVHYPHDILGGLFIGVILALLYQLFLNRIDAINLESQHIGANDIN